MESEYRFVGGLNLGMVRIYPPHILLSASEAGLVFNVRYGLDRWFGPWILVRDDVKEVYRQQRGLNLYRTIGLLKQDGTWWSFFTFHSRDVLRALQLLNYPLAPDAAAWAAEK